MVPYVASKVTLLFLSLWLPAAYTLFPYTTLFRSRQTKARTMSVSEEQNLMRASCRAFVDDVVIPFIRQNWQDRKSTRLNSSHLRISYAVFCLDMTSIPTKTRISVACDFQRHRSRN